MIFDSWGGALSHAAYREFSLRYMQKIIDGLNRHAEGRQVPVTLFTKGGGLWLEAMAETGCDALGLDWTIDIGDARKRVGDKVACRAIWTHRLCTHLLSVFVRKWHRSWPAMVKERAMYSTWAMVSTSMWILSTPEPSSSRYTSCLPSTTSKHSLNKSRIAGFFIAFSVMAGLLGW